MNKLYVMIVGCCLMTGCFSGDPVFPTSSADGGPTIDDGSGNDPDPGPTAPATTHRVYSLTVAMLNASSDFYGVKFPDGFSVAGLDSAGRNYDSVDFTGTTGLTVAMINASSSINWIKLPAGLDMNGFDPTGKGLT